MVIKLNEGIGGKAIKAPAQHIQQQLVAAGHIMGENLIITGLVNKCNNWLFILLIFYFNQKQPSTEA